MSGKKRWVYAFNAFYRRYLKSRKNALSMRHNHTPAGPLKRDSWQLLFGAILFVRLPVIVFAGLQSPPMGQVYHGKISRKVQLDYLTQLCVLSNKKAERI